MHGSTNHGEQLKHLKVKESQLHTTMPMGLLEKSSRIYQMKKECSNHWIGDWYMCDILF